MHFDVKARSNQSTRDRALIRLLKTTGILVSASNISKTRFLSPDSNKLCDGENLFIEKKQADDISNIIDEEIVAMTDELLEHKCISTKQRNFWQTKC